jgi:hypothetical protein
MGLWKKVLGWPYVLVAGFHLSPLEEPVSAAKCMGADMLTPRTRVKVPNKDRGQPSEARSFTLFITPSDLAFPFIPTFASSQTHSISLRHRYLPPLIMSIDPLQSLHHRFETSLITPEDSLIVYAQASADRVHFDTYPTSNFTSSIDNFATHLPELCALFAVQISGPLIRIAIESA